jgi:DNA ligase-1
MYYTLEELNVLDDLEEIKSICEQLQTTNSKKDKEETLKDNQGNQLFKDVLYFLLNPFIITGLSEKKINKNACGSAEKINNIFEMIEYLKDNNTGKDNDILTCQRFINNYDIDMQEFIKSILTKSLKLGCDATTVNKIYGKGFIPVFDVMLGTPIDKCKIPEGTWFSISHKLNGSRCLYYKDDFYTRQGHKYTGLEHIKEDLQKVLINPNIVVDGELLRKNVDGQTDSQNFQIGVGIANSKADTKEELKLMIFDMITVNDFEHGKSKFTYKERKPEVEALKETIHQLGLKNVDVVDMFYEGTDQSQIWHWLDYAEKNDLEGVMLNLDTPYECKRTKNLIKVKQFHECDIKCTGIENGTGRNKNTLGAIICDYKGNSVGVGSGFSDEQRNYYYNNPNEIVGKIVTVKYKEETKNKNGGISIQFPVLQCVRFDKNEPSYN